MEHKNEDRRVKMTKKFLRQSLIDLMKEKNIHTITIKEVCDLADINRSTFYKHYESVYALYDDIIEEILDNIAFITNTARENGTVFTSQYVESILNYAERNRELILVILSDKGNVGIGEEITRNTDRFLEGHQTNEFMRYCVQFMTAGMTSIIWMWLKEEERSTSGELASIISAMMSRGIKGAIQLFRNPDLFK